MSETRDCKVALIVGASRGLGFGLVEAFLARDWDVVATVRNARGRAALEALGAGDRLSVLTMDVTVEEDIARLRQELAGKMLDVLFVNAGIACDPAVSVEDTPVGDFVDVMVTNAFAPLRVIAGVHDRVRPDGVVAAMSSNMGSVSGNAGGAWEIYRASKAALNQLMKSFAARHADDRTYLAVSPGWVRTDMGGDFAPLDIATSTPGIVETLIARAGERGVHFVDFNNRVVPW